MTSKKLILALLVVVMMVSMGGCSFMQTSGTSATSHSQFIEVPVGNGTEEININHIVTVQPSTSNSANTLILMDTSNGMNGGIITTTESYDQIVKELNGNQ